MKLNREPAMNMFKILRLFLDSCIFFTVTPNINQSKCIGNQIIFAITNLINASSMKLSFQIKNPEKSVICTI